MKTICDDCEHFWRVGLPGNKQHIWCTVNGGRKIKNKLKGCSDYSKVTTEKSNRLRKRRIKGSKK